MDVHISICENRDGVSMAVFDEKFNTPLDFEDYPNEEEALKVARKFCEDNGHTVTKVVHPRITKMTGTFRTVSRKARS